jgi:proteic killer suppression protein
VIKSFARSSLKRFFENGIAKGVPQDMAKRLQVRLDALAAAAEVTEMNVPGWDFHELKVQRRRG